MIRRVLHRLDVRRRVRREQRKSLLLFAYAFVGSADTDRRWLINGLRAAGYTTTEATAIADEADRVNAP